MNIPNSFKFVTKYGLTFTATESGKDNFRITSNGKLVAFKTLKDVTKLLGEGIWTIINEPKTDYETLAQNIGKLVAEKNKQTNIPMIKELQTLAEHINYLRDKSSNNSNDDLIMEAKKIYMVIASEIRKKGDSNAS